MRNPQSTIAEKIKALLPLINLYESLSESHEYEYNAFLLLASKLYSKAGGDKNHDIAYEFAETAENQCRPNHAELLEAYLRQVDCIFQKSVPTDLTPKLNNIHEVLSFHIGQDHPFQIRIFEGLGDIFLQFQKDSDTLHSYETAEYWARLHLGVDHKVRLRLLKKIVHVKITLDQIEEAFLMMLEIIEIMKRHKMQNTVEMAVTFNDLVRVSMEVGDNSEAFNVIMDAQKAMLGHLKGHPEFEKPPEARDEQFLKYLDCYYENCKWTKRLCVARHKSFKFLRRFCNDFNHIINADVKMYKDRFLFNRCPENHKGRCSAYRKLIKCYCLLATLLLSPREKIIFVNFLDRFHFDSMRGTDEKCRKILRISALGNIYAQVEQNLLKDPYDVLKKMLGFFLEHALYLQEVIEKYRYMETIHFHYIDDEDVLDKVREFGSWVSLCGFLNFKEFLMDQEA